MLDDARLITAPDDHDGSAPLFVRSFRLDPDHGAVASAHWLVTAHGVVEPRLGGRPVAPDVLTPGWSSYEWRLRVRDLDVTEVIRDLTANEPGAELEASALVGHGWWAGRLTWEPGRRHLYGDTVGFAGRLELTFDDGHRQTVVTDGDWRVRGSDVLDDDLYDGQTIDARRRGDTLPERPVVVNELDPGVLVGHPNPPIVRHEELAPVQVTRSPSGRTLVDFGQNLVGWVRATVRGDAGAVVTLRHAEVLEDRELGVRPLRDAKATDRFVLSGGTDVFEPTLTFHGFRYVEVDGWPEGVDLASGLRAVVVSSDLRRTGTFESSHDGLNQLHRNVVWGLRGNVVGVPTDCPQRDERLGWTGDLAVFAPSACFLYDVGPFLADWLRDLRAEQVHQHGRVPFVVPDPLKYLSDDAATPAIWADAAVWVPWAAWQAYGDAEALAEAYPAMVDHVDHVTGLLSPSGLWDTGFQFGDWLDPAAPAEAADQARADKGVVATAAFIRSCRLTAEAARLLGHDADAARLDEVATRTTAAFNEHWVGDDGTVFSDCPTVYALAIVFGLLEGDRLTGAGDRLAQLTRDEGHVIATGFAGTPFVCDALTLTGHLDDAMALLLQTACPSWLYPVTMGATTIWERWDSMLPDGSINPGSMTSFNHYALGAVADWLHRSIAGLAPAEPGYARVRFAPVLPSAEQAPGLDWAGASLDTPHGRVSIRWERAEANDQETGFRVELETPVEAELVLPGVPAEQLPAGRHVRVVAAG
ncbi:family 78 glycoside hydrolase catalytic domain [Aestuariimicrobium soli]|uniref:alpha-L-rhamnosidase n=1 Tax=Aestuariimicrobium soli TaxID=2035834 RepID=UPI003EBC2106